MGTSNLILIFAAEVIALSLFAIAILVLKNRKLKNLISKMQKRLDEMVKQLRQKRPAPTEPAPQPATNAPSESYQDHLDTQLELTKDYHYDLGSRQDISLDLDPDSPLQRRTAALRNAFLVAEKASVVEDQPVDWDLLATKYQQILAYNEDYAPQVEQSTEDLTLLEEELEQAKKRINNLERFKTLYFELEEKWESAKSKANEHYAELKNLASSSDQSEGLETLIENYHLSYQSIDTIIEQGLSTDIEVGPSSATHIAEIQKLRDVAADQHRIITELQEKLASAHSIEEKSEVVEGLQTELQKQARFLQESETCIKLMEDELNHANDQIDMLKSRAVMVPQLKAALKELQSNADRRDQIVDSLKTENRRLAKKLQLAQEAPPESNDEARKLRAELTNLQSKYNDLEEKFLNLKLKG